LATQDQIKGILLVDFARIIRARKDLPWDKYLIEEDMNLIQGKIMPGAWYPIEILERVGYAVFVLVGKGDLKNAWAFGAFTIEDTFRKVYKNILFDKLDPVEMITKFILLRKQFTKFSDPDFETLKLESLGENRAKVIFKIPRLGVYIGPYTHQLAGGFEKLLEMSGARDIQVNILKIQSETEPASEIELSWSLHAA
jgi:hypothetical protein